jgi:hypothetical protein
MVREYIENGVIETKSVKSLDNIADFNTKALPEPAFKKGRSNMGIFDIPKVITGEVKFDKYKSQLEDYDWNSSVCTCVWNQNYEGLL